MQFPVTTLTTLLLSTLTTVSATTCITFHANFSADGQIQSNLNAGSTTCSFNGPGYPYDSFSLKCDDGSQTSSSSSFAYFANAGDVGYVYFTDKAGLTTVFTVHGTADAQNGGFVFLQQSVCA